MRRERRLTGGERPSRGAGGSGSPKVPTRSIGARVTIPVFDLIDAAAAFTNVPRSKVVEDGATQRARDIIQWAHDPVGQAQAPGP